MKCPKCGYTSFDHLDSCKKCGKDLVEFKERYGIRSILFPGAMSASQAANVEEDLYDSDTADAAVAAATAGTAAVAATVSTAAVDEAKAADDDFGFDFMGDSDEDDDLSFDELFEDAPDDEDVEESIEAPAEEAAADVASATTEEADDTDDFSFDLPESDGLEDDFGFDPEEVSAEGDEEDPKSPFELPESPVVEEAPDHNFSFTDRAVAPATVALEQELAEHLAEPFEAKSSVAVVESSASPDDLSDAELQGQEHFDYSAAAPVAAAAVAGAAGLAGGDAVEEFASDFSVEEAGADDPDYAPAGVMSRVIAFICDLVLLVMVGGSFVAVAEAAMSANGGHYLPTMATLLDLSIPYFLVLFSLGLGYFTLFHFLVGQTPGKMITAIRVETLDGDSLSFGHAFLRSVGGLLQLLPIGVGFLLILFNTDQRGWNDRLAGTKVVNLKKVIEK